MTELDIAEHRQPQDGKIDFTCLGGEPVERRMVTVPTARWRTWYCACWHGRPHDLVGRLGGEAFVIGWSGITLDQAAEIAERLRLAVVEADWREAAAELRVSASIGVAPLASPGDGPPTLGELLAGADHALYAAKRAGRNQVVVYRPAP
jgi:predicted signal transduction protein with EAL and GGDEF domain